jgi:hypothetical protein
LRGHGRRRDRLLQVSYDESGVRLRGNRWFTALLLTAGALFAQHGGEVRAGSAISFGHGGGRVAASSVPRRNASFIAHRSASRPALVHQRFGNGFFAPYFPFVGDYTDDSSPGVDYFASIDDGVDQPSALTMARPSPPLRTAHSVIQNYNWNDQSVVGAGDQATFTIVLKDGSTRSAVATWVQGRTLHYTDSDEGNGVLSSDQIDRETTRRMNKGKKISTQLPPD